MYRQTVMALCTEFENCMTHFQFVNYSYSCENGKDNIYSHTYTTQRRF